MTSILSFGSQDAAKSDSFQAERLSTTLSDSALLRGTSQGTLTECFGYRLKNGAGGLATGESGDYSKSYVVRRLQTFMSHSWHAPWLAKYFSLLFHFNSKASIVITAITGIACHILPPSIGSSEPKMPGLNVVVGLLVLSLSLIMWQNLCPGWAQCNRNVFFDQVCIHQADPELKTQGIRAIGAMIAHSDTLLVVWDSSYFTRLWCVYEISVFKYFKPRGCMTIIPVELGTMVMVLLAVYSAHVVLARGFMHVGGFSTEFVMISTEFICYLALMPSIRSSLSASRVLQKQLRTFSVSRSHCFCCTNNHVHPVSGAVIPCDRELVYNAITQLYGDSDAQDGLQAFDVLVQSRLFEDVLSSLGRSWLIPLSWAQVLGLPYFLLLLDVSDLHSGWWNAAIWVQRVFLNGPLYGILILGICYISEPFCLTWRWPKPVMHVALACLISIASSLLNCLQLEMLDPAASCFASFGLTATEALIVLWVYLPRARLPKSLRQTSFELKRFRGDAPASEVM